MVLPSSEKAVEKALKFEPKHVAQRLPLSFNQPSKPKVSRHALPSHSIDELRAQIFRHCRTARNIAPKATQADPRALPALGDIIASDSYNIKCLRHANLMKLEGDSSIHMQL